MEEKKNARNTSAGLPARQVLPRGHSTEISISVLAHQVQIGQELFGSELRAKRQRCFMDLR